MVGARLPGLPMRMVFAPCWSVTVIGARASMHVGGSEVLGNVGHGERAPPPLTMISACRVSLVFT